MTQHFNETVNAANKGIASDTFAKHFANAKTIEGKTTAKHIRDRTSLDILWQGNPLSSAKSFGKLNCALCMKERLEIMKAMKNQPTRLINSSKELYGACRHRPVFHRYTNYTTSADEGLTGLKRVNVSTDKNLAKRGRGRPRKGTVFKNIYGGNLLCTEINTKNCTDSEISPLSTNGLDFSFE